MQYKVGIGKLLEKLDMVKVEINNKIETEIRKINPLNKMFIQHSYKFFRMKNSFFENG